MIIMLSLRYSYHNEINFIKSLLFGYFYNHFYENLKRNLNGELLLTVLLRLQQILVRFHTIF
jgi:hypothetical protein